SALSRQRIVEELVVVLAIAGAERETQIVAGPGNLEQTTLEVRLDDRLAHFRTVLQVRAYGFEAVFAEAAGRRNVEVQAGRAGGRRSAEPALHGIALLLEAAAEVARLQHRAHALERVDARLPGMRRRYAMIDIGFPGPVGARNRAFEASHEVVGGDVGERLAVVGQQRRQ